MMDSARPAPVRKWQSLNPSSSQGRGESLFSEEGDLPPLFAPSMRSVIEYPQDEVEIVAPPAKPGIPTSSLVAVLLPLVGVIAMGILSVILIKGASPLYPIISGVMVLASATVGIFSFISQRKKYRAELAKREKLYLNHLAACSRDLEHLRQQQLSASLTPHPDPAGCLQRAQLRDSDHRLWERSPQEDDFLDLRMGTGARPATYAIKFSLSPNERIEQDPLTGKARAIVREYTSIENMAVTLPLGRLGVVGCCGSQSQAQMLGRALLLQIATHHAPNEVKVVLVYPDAEKKEWDWARWLPHIWSEESNRRLIASSPQEATDLLVHIGTLFNRRQLDFRKEAREKKPVFFPQYVFLFFDPEVINNANSAPYNKLFAMLMTEGAALGASVVLFQPVRNQLDRACRAVIQLGDKPSLYLSAPRPETVPFAPDSVPLDLSDRFARTLAPLRLNMRSREQNRDGTLPKSVSLFQLLAINKPEEMRLDQTWSQHKPIVTLAGPIGVQSDGLTIFSLQEGAEHGFGPHAVVGGMTGTGKTKGLLHTLILSLAVHNHPNDLNFLLIDYKGGDLYEGLQDLPHVVGCLGNLEGARKQGALVRRLFRCLEAELKRRRVLLGSASINDFHREQRSSRRQPDLVLPHLVVVIDEFAELISKNSPEVVDALKSNLVSIARTGRSLGIHLLLATQEPGTVIRGDIRDAINLFLCLGMGTREASKELLETEDAYIENMGKQIGRAYFKAKRENLINQFQVAYSSEKLDYLAVDMDMAGTRSIREVGLSGGTQTRGTIRRSAAVERDTVPLFNTQKEGVAFWISRYAQQQGIQRLPNPFLALLPETLDLRDIRGKNEGWNGKTWQVTRRQLAPIVGIADDPDNLVQPAQTLDLGRYGHLAVYGMDAAETTSFLHTLILSLALDHTPVQLNLYILDLEGQQLSMLRPLPHMGDIILADETERALRLLGFLQRELKRRKEVMGAAGYASFSDFQAHSSKNFPAIVLVVNNFTQLEAASEVAVEMLFQLLDQGAAQYNIHCVLTGNRSNAIPKRIANLVQLAVALSLNPSDDASIIVGGRLADLPQPLGIPMRGLLRATPPVEFQTASVSQSSAIVSAMNEAWGGERPPAVPVLRENIPLRELVLDQPVDRNDPQLTLSVGVSTGTLDAVPAQLGRGVFHLVTGQPQSGKTTFIQSWLLALACQYPPEELHFHFICIGPKNQRLFILRNLPHTKTFVETEEALKSLLTGLQEEINRRRAAFDAAVRDATDLIDEDRFMAQYPRTVLVLDDYDQLVKSVQDRALVPALEQLTRRGMGFGLYGLLGVQAKEITASLSSDPLVRRFRETQSGVLFDRSDASNLFSYQGPKALVGPMPPGRGFLISKGIYQPFQAAWAGGDGSPLSEWIELVKQRQLS